MSDKLVKEIITTTTERYGDNGSIKEKVTETREKVYEYGYTEKQIAEAQVVEAQPLPAPIAIKEDKPQELSKEELIKQAAKNIDEHSTVKKPQEPAPAVPTTTNASPVNPYEAYLAKQPVAKTKFPWEEGK